MHAEVSSEATEIVTMAVDKYLSQGKYEQASRVIKDTMDKKFGPSWHCCIGEGFGFEVSCTLLKDFHRYSFFSSKCTFGSFFLLQVTYQQRHMIYLFYGEKLGILLFKC